MLSRLINGLVGVQKLRSWTLHVEVRCAPRWFRWQCLAGLSKSEHAICKGSEIRRVCSAILCNRAMSCSHRGYKWITVTSVRLGWQLTRTQPWCSSKKVSMPTQEIFYDGKNAWQLLGGLTVWSHQHAEWQFTCTIFGKAWGNSCAHMSQLGITGNKHSSSYPLTATL